MKIRGIRLVEDDPQDEQLALRTLTSVNMIKGIGVVHEGAAAVACPPGRGDHAERDTADLPGLVMLGIEPPTPSCSAVLRRLRAGEKTKPLPVLIATSADGDRERIAGYGLVADGFIRKPVGFGERGKSVARLWVRRVAVDEPSCGPEPNG